MNLNPKKLRYKRVQGVKKIQELLIGDMYQISFFSYKPINEYGHEQVDIITYFGNSSEKKVKDLENGDLLVTIKD